MALLLSSCVSVGAPKTPVPCGVGDDPIRLSNEAINLLTDEQAKIILERNEDLAKRGCAKPSP